MPKPLSREKMSNRSATPPVLSVDAQDAVSSVGVTGLAAPHSASYGTLTFESCETPKGFGPLWRSYTVSDGGALLGHFHLCAPGARWQITIHDFTLPRDTLMEFKLPEYLSVAWYESISGEEFGPYHKLRAKTLWGFYSGEQGWMGLVHGGVPIRSISIEIRPEMSHEYLEAEYGGAFSSVKDAFTSLSDMEDFPQMKSLLRGLWPKPGDEGRTALYYEGKVLEALGLIVEKSRGIVSSSSGTSLAMDRTLPERFVSADDRQRIRDVMAFVDDHCASDLRVADLARIACMGTTKFKECFKAIAGTTLTAYLQGRRMSQAEALLRQKDLSIEQIARAVGYTCPSRFSELFQRETGLLPSEFRKGL